jgi:hypothetical protein
MKHSLLYPVVLLMLAGLASAAEPRVLFEETFDSKPGDDEVSIQCYNGPPEAEHWIRFDDFRIVAVGD